MTFSASMCAHGKLLPCLRAPARASPSCGPPLSPQIRPLGSAGARRAAACACAQVEGAELLTLESLRWSVPVHVLTVERNQHNAAINALLLQHGFEYVREYLGDRLWVNTSWWRGLPRQPTR